MPKAVPATAQPLIYSYHYRAFMNDTFKIMLVDDDEDDRMLFALAVSEINPSHSYILIENCNEALDNLVNIQPEIIFLDLNMPDMHGFECLEKIKATTTTSHIPVVIYSTSGYCVDIEKAKELGAAGYLKKPSDFDDLCIKLKEAIAHIRSGNTEYYISS